ncbi:hypothetical protein HWV62_2539 [Athelia sp. TMB]|nr:hypothetical protein HWV62_2539 [Athelia sp. TMB]
MACRRRGVGRESGRRRTALSMRRPGDTCASIGAWTGLTASQIEALNPGVNCSVSLAPLVDHLFCLESITPVCTRWVTTLPTDTCASVAAEWEISQDDFTDYNDNLDSNCDNFVPGQQYCVSDIECFLGNDDPYCSNAQ